MNKRLILFRHVDTDKNVLSRFSDTQLGESITEEGYRQLKEISDSISQLRNSAGFKVDKIFCSPSSRSKQSAAALAEELGIGISVLTDFDSINSGSLAGRTEQEAKAIAPTFLKQLALYRSGLFSSYNIELPSDAESVMAFESRIQKQLVQLLVQETSEVVLIFSHRSPITAALLYFARKFQKYPSDFYGARSHLGSFIMVSSPVAGSIR